MLFSLSRLAQLWDKWAVPNLWSWWCYSAHWAARPWVFLLYPSQQWGKLSSIGIIHHLFFLACTGVILSARPLLRCLFSAWTNLFESCVLSYLTSSSPVSLFRSEDLDGDGSDSDLSSSPSAQDLESYKLLYEIANTIGRYGDKSLLHFIVFVFLCNSNGNLHFCRSVLIHSSFLHIFCT